MCLIPNTLSTTGDFLTLATRTDTMHDSVPRREMRTAGRHFGLSQECLPAQEAGSLGADSDGAPVNGVHPPHF